MHYFCLVVGADPRGQLEAFSRNTAVAPYKRFPDDVEIGSMVLHFSLPPDRPEAFVPRMDEWCGGEGGVEDGRLFVWSTENPAGKFDWYVKGGRFDGRLVLKEPPRLSRFRRLFGAKVREGMSEARKGEIRSDLLIADPPAALLVDGEWHEGPFSPESGAAARWTAEFAARFSALPDDAHLAVMDLHD